MLGDYYKIPSNYLYKLMAITLPPTSRENQKEVDNADNKIIFLKSSFLNDFQNLKDPRIDRSKDHLLIDIIAISILAVITY